MISVPPFACSVLLLKILTNYKGSQFATTTQPVKSKHLHGGFILIFNILVYF